MTARAGIIKSLADLVAVAVEFGRWQIKLVVP